MRNTHCIGRNGRSSRHGCVFLKSPAWEIDPYGRNTTERVSTHDSHQGGSVQRDLSLATGLSMEFTAQFDR